MRLKYIIPLALCALMVMAAVPVYAASNHQLNDANSVVNDYFSVTWNPLPSTQSISASSGDFASWNNQWKHNDAKSGIPIYYIGQSTDGVYKVKINEHVGLSYGQTYGSTTGGLPISSVPSQLNRYHTYGSNPDTNPFDSPSKSTGAAVTYFG